jgi:hypothetical protein
MMRGKLELMAPFDYMKLCSTHVYLWLWFFGYCLLKYWIIIFQIGQYNYNVGIVSTHSKLLGSLLLSVDTKHMLIYHTNIGNNY